MKYWICTSESNLEFLESIGVVVGEREGRYWRNCTIPDDMETHNDLFEHWGSGDEETIMWGEEDGRPPFDPLIEELDSKTKSVRRKAAHLRAP